MKKLLLAFAVMFSMGAVLAQSKVAHVNSDTLLKVMPSRLDAMKKLQEFEAAGIKELQEMEAAFNKAVADYKAKEKDLTPMLKQIEEDKLMQRQQTVAEREQSLQQEMQIYSQELNKPILDRLQKAVEIVSERRKLNYVIDQSVTLYFKGGVDITQEVLVELLRLDAEAMKQ